MDSTTLDHPTSNHPRRLLKWVAVTVTLILFCVLGTFLDPFRWGVFRRPTYAERAAEFRAESAEWERLARENPKLSKAYRKTAEEAREAADRLERRVNKAPRS